MTEGRNHRNRSRAESFGSAATSYDRARPGYPPALIDDLLDSKPTRALDVGCGTGKAAALLAERGVEVLGVEVDDRMAEVGRGHGLTVETAAFERWDAAGREFDLIVCGQAWHWLEPVAASDRIVRLLRPGGEFATFWNFAVLDPRVRAALESVYRTAAPRLSESSVLRGGGPATVHNYQPELARAFGAVRERDYEWEVHYTRDAWLDLISTHSDHLELPAAQLETVLGGIGSAIDGFGGSMLVRYRTMALFARRG